jgi:hypothetical protein
MDRRKFIATAGSLTTGLAALPTTVAAESATIRVVDEPSGTYTNGELVELTVRVTNNGDTDETFYAGFSVYGPDGEFYDNDKSTDEETSTLAPGQSETRTLEWEVTSGAPDGKYGYVTAVYADRENNGDSDEMLINRLDSDDKATEDVFEVDPY